MHLKLSNNGCFPIHSILALFTRERCLSSSPFSLFIFYFGCCHGCTLQRLRQMHSFLTRVFCITKDEILRWADASSIKWIVQRKTQALTRITFLVLHTPAAIFHHRPPVRSHRNTQHNNDKDCCSKANLVSLIVVAILFAFIFHEPHLIRRQRVHLLCNGNK